MGLWKRGKQYWLDVVVHGERHREPLGTTDWRQARELEKKKIAELQNRPTDPTKSARRFSALSVPAAIDQYADERRSQVSGRMVAWWKEMGRPATSRCARSHRPISPRIRMRDEIADAHPRPSTPNSLCCDSS